MRIFPVIVPGFKHLSFFLFLFPLAGFGLLKGSGKGSERLLYERATSLYDRGQYLLSAEHFSFLIATHPYDEWGMRSLFAYGLAMAELGERDEAIDSVRKLYRTPHENRAKIFLALNDVYLEARLPSEIETRLALWRLRLDPQPFRSKISQTSLSASAKEDLLKLSLQIETAPHKNSLVAGIASGLLPGAGQAYVGSWQSAGIALALNAIFALTTIEFANQHLWAATAASGLVFSVTYLGNILNAVSAANRFNDSHRQLQESALRQKLFPELRP